MTEEPLITAVCCTYGRVERLSEALACFLKQTYRRKQLLILNSFSGQHLVFRHPDVKIVNLQDRPVSLGATRNVAVREATGDILFMADDDDLMLPNHFRNIADAFAANPQAEWIRLDPVFYAEAWSIKKPFSTWANAVAFTRAAWQKVGGYLDTLSVGEDRAFISRLSTFCHGVVYPLEPEKVSVIYCWGNNVYHVSGQGDDRPGRVNAYERSRYELQQRINKGQEPRGEVYLAPRLQHDPEAMRRAYLGQAGEQKREKAKATCLVMLGRNGDIVNILPIAYHLYVTTGEKPYLMVSREFAPLVMGVSYVEPHVVSLQYSELKEAMDLATKEYGKVIRCQVYGKGHDQPRQTEAYNKESWREAGFLEHFDNSDWRPIFDQRDYQYEQAIARKLFRRQHLPKIITSISGGLSSPFKFGKQMAVHLRQRLGKTHEVVEIGHLQLDKIFHVLGILERSDLIITSDTAILHLAAACATPVIALVNPAPWLGSAPRCNCIARIPYDDATLDRVVQCAENFLERRAAEIPKVNEVVPIVPVKKTVEYKAPPTIFHAVERHQEGNAAEQKRKTAAWVTWDALYAKGVVPCHYWKYSRDAREIGDKRALPYLKDVLAGAMKEAQESDIILWTNDDVCLHKDLLYLLPQHVAQFEACTSHRIDFAGPMPPPSCPPESFARLGLKHIGRDLLACSKKWLAEHWEDFPDFILGASDFDLCLASMVRLKWGVETTRPNVEEIFYPAEIPPGYVAHQCHKPFWVNPGNVNTAPSQLHNRKLFKAWADKYLPSLRFTPILTI